MKFSIALTGDMPYDEQRTLVEDFTRVQTFGSATNHWVELVIDPHLSRAKNNVEFNV